jgi:hypothetical protein
MESTLNNSYAELPDADAAANSAFSTDGDSPASDFMGDGSRYCSLSDILEDEDEDEDGSRDLDGDDDAMSLSRFFGGRY